MMGQDFVEITHCQEFSAAHRLHCEELSEAENAELYGICNTDHGHNYVVEVSVRGPLSQPTGMVMDLNRLRLLIVEHIINPVEHKHLNHHVPFLEGVVPTAENVAVAFWKQLEPHLKAYPACQLTRIRLRESRMNYVDYSGPSPSKAS